MWEVRGAWTLITLPFVLLYCVAYGLCVLVAEIIKAVQAARERHAAA